MSCRFAALALALAALAAVFAQPVRAETLAVAVSTPLVQITSNFNGTDITVFGTVERDRVTVGRAEAYRLAVQVFGPPETVVTRRKERSFGIWVNRAKRIYAGVPTFYASLTTDPIAELATPEALRRYQIGLGNVLLPERIEGGNEALVGDPEFRAAFLRLKTQHGLYRELPGRVEFLTPSLFRATVPIPANVPVGKYRVQVVLLQGGLPLADETAEILVVKSGFEQFTYALAFDQPLIYGAVTVMLALMTGWIAGVMFRRD